MVSSLIRRGTSSKHLILFGGAGLLVAAVVLLAYFGTEILAKERKAAKGPLAVPVSIAPVEQKSMPFQLQAIGNVEAYATVSVKARVDGQIVAVNFREGQPVKKGDILFRLDARPYEAALRQAEANVLRDAAARDQAQSQAKRYQELLEKGFISKEAYAQIRTNAETAEAIAKASQAALENARLNLEYCTIISPLSGYVGKTLLQAGNLARANDNNPLVVINQVMPIYVNFAIPEQNLPDVRKYMAAAPLTVEVILPDPVAPHIAGQLIFVDNAVDPSTGTIRLRARFDNSNAALWPGQFVNVSLRLFEQADAIVIPAQAVQTGPDGQYVYVVGKDMVADVRRITVQRSDGDWAVVGSGLVRGEQVVTRGQLRLGPRTRVQTSRSGPEAS